MLWHTVGIQYSETWPSARHTIGALTGCVQRLCYYSVKHLACDRCT